MRAYLAVTGTLFALFSAMHFWITWEHALRAGTTTWDWLAPLLIGILAAVLAAWAYRLVRSTRGSPAA